MLSPDAKAIWRSKNGQSLMQVLLGEKEPDAGDRATAKLLADMSAETDGVASDAWSETDHQRAPNGQFGAGGGGGQVKPADGSEQFPEYHKAAQLAHTLSKNARTAEQHVHAAWAHYAAKGHLAKTQFVGRNAALQGHNERMAYHATEHAKLKGEEARNRAKSDAGDLASDRAIVARARVAADGLAFDRGTVRLIDRDGRLHIEVTNISKAAVNGYLGSEIPNWQEMGLEPTKIYQLLRDPKELEAGADTFNNIPVLSEHVQVSATNHRPDLVVGSTGTDAVFDAPYLKNSMVVWSQEAIDGIESGEQRELSCAYRYTPVMEPGNYKGVHYDGRMTAIVGNHVALVSSGRCGNDVLVGDSNIELLWARLESSLLFARDVFPR